MLFGADSGSAATAVRPRKKARASSSVSSSQGAKSPSSVFDPYGFDSYDENGVGFFASADSLRYATDAAITAQKQSQPPPSAAAVPAPAPPTASSPAAQRAVYRISEFMLRYGMVAYGCRTEDGSAATSVTCLSVPVSGVPAVFSRLFDVKGFTSPWKQEMLTAAGHAYLETLTKEALRIEAAGAEWEVTFASSSHTLADYPYAAAGLPLIVRK
jgi:hypothetical protein